ncbi:hypothetical protein BN1723_003861 [Verticillium longisporum]|uniref:Uncharacterized protein n=1 Tax=Verticillium longisporum TaxID=100787 RepID=A0A0G4MD24_VERLO|nr:hypothetical protein HYQ46_012970 [Verticillium longisporum]CRK32199.1 hypothetical protein BN1723_003861 [Verticillium longisporum]
MAPQEQTPSMLQLIQMNKSITETQSAIAAAQINMAETQGKIAETQSKMAETQNTIAATQQSMLATLGSPKPEKQVAIWTTAFLSGVTCEVLWYKISAWELK